MPESDHMAPGTVMQLDSGKISLAGEDLRVLMDAKLPDTDPAYALIGRVAAEWAHLEHTLDRLFGNSRGSIKEPALALRVKWSDIAPGLMPS